MASAAVDQDDGSAVPTIELGDGRVSPGTRRRIEQSRAQGEGGGSGVVAVTSSVDEAPATAAEQQSLAEDEQEAASSSGGGYTAEHLAAVMKPVTITMLLASWIVVNIREPAQDAAIASGLRYPACVFHSCACTLTTKLWGNGVLPSTSQCVHGV